MQFSEVMGRKAEKEMLCDLVQKNRLPHSLLFLGNEGGGALSMALAFAQYILCERVHQKNVSAPQTSLFGQEAPQEQASILRSDSCGACAACLKAEKNIHPDLHFSYPVLKKNKDHTRILSTDYISEWREFLTENPYGNVTDWLNFLKESPSAGIEKTANKQGNISVHECEDILRKLSLKPFESDYKILIMWMPEFMGKEGNRLLKLIEEPPEGTIFIFVAEDESKILPTILSRTQLIRIPLPADADIEEFLIQKGSDPRQAKQVASLAFGNLREALRQTISQDENWLQIIRTWMNIIYANKVSAQLKWIDEVNEAGKEKQKQLLQYLLHLIEMSIRIQFTGMDTDENDVGEENAFAGTLSKMCPVEVLEEMANELNDAVYYIERNAYSKLLFHALTIRFFHLIREKKVILIS